MPHLPSSEFENSAITAGASTPNPTMFERLPTSVKSVMAIATLAVASGCSSTGPRPHEGTNIRVHNGHVHIPAASTYPVYQENAPVDHKLNRTLGGGAVGYLVCRVLGATPAGSLGCAIVGGAIGNETYKPEQVTQRDMVQLERQMNKAYNGGLSSEAKVVDSNTRYVSVTKRGMIGKEYHVRFRVQEVTSAGRFAKGYYVHAIPQSAASEGGQALRLTPPILFPGESELPPVR